MRIVAGAFALATILACATVDSVGNGAGPTELPTATSSGIGAVRREYEIDTRGLRESPAQLLTDYVVWSSVSSAGSPVDRIYEYSLRTADVRIIRTAPARTRIQLVHASDAWVVWFEAVRDDGADAKLYALPRSGGTPMLVDDMARYAPLAAVPELTLDGADLYWTTPVLVGTTWRGALHHRTLPSGETDVVVQAPDGALVGWPSAHAGELAYEVSSQDGHSRVYLRREGATSVVPVEPASEPALGDGFIAFKQEKRFNAGDLAAYVISSGAIVSLGAGEAPTAHGRFAAWYVGKDGRVRLASPLAACARDVAGGASATATEWLPSLGAGRMAYLRRDASQTTPVDTYIVSTLPRSGCG